MKTTNLKSIQLLLGGLVWVWCQGVNAATCDVQDVKFGVSSDGSTPTQSAADLCSGPVNGNDPWGGNPNGVNLVDFNNEGGTWFDLAKWDFGSAPVSGSPVDIFADGIVDPIGTISFSLTAGGIVDGYNTFDLNWTYAFGPAYLDYIPVTLDLNIVTKQSNGLAQYFFNNEKLFAGLSPSTGYGEGSFRINYKCTGGPVNGTCEDQNPSTGFSHLSIYGRNFIPNSGGGGGGSGNPVPEPSALALLGIGLLGMSLSRKLKSA